ncbi:hypothetical protein PBAL39_00375 [Pedobacter sp. BAL39]|uniref:Bor/Iss family lipoprotein n=1 Tax=Pedobacter sp. BAL39 TaxID=391596 RepID=UPI000155A176|nr:hypothetical protein PBAL39_00375 [Pedobacter sp. BAL39]
MHLLPDWYHLTNGYEAKKLIGDRKDYIVKTQHTFVDGLLELVTLSIYTQTTTTFYVPLKDVETK